MKSVTRTGLLLGFILLALAVFSTLLIQQLHNENMTLPEKDPALAQPE